MSKLFQETAIRDLILRNRIVISPMVMYSSIDGYSSDFHLVHYGSRASGGAGLVMFEATAVSPEGRITDKDLGIYLDEHVEGLKRINHFIHEFGGKSGIQLAHAGRKASFSAPQDGGTLLLNGQGGWTTLAPSAVAFSSNSSIPHELDELGIAKIKEDFKAAALRAYKANFDVVEIHAAHGYLIHQFLSPISNQRTDNYGGSFENRIRLLCEIVDEVRKEWPSDKPLFVRISATDWVEGGWDDTQSVELAKILKKKEVDFIDVSSGGAVPKANIPIRTGYQVPFSNRIKREAGILTGAVGLIVDPKQANEILEEEKADLIFIGRASLRDPNWPQYAAKVLDDEIQLPNQYLRAGWTKK